MPFNISTNSAAASAGYYLGKNQSALQKSLTRLASGKKIIAPYDDPGSLSVSMKLQAYAAAISLVRDSPTIPRSPETLTMSGSECFECVSVSLFIGFPWE